MPHLQQAQLFLSTMLLHTSTAQVLGLMSTALVMPINIKQIKLEIVLLLSVTAHLISLFTTTQFNTP